MNKMIQRSKKNLKNRKGFTLIELIVVIAILGLLAAILIPQFTGFQDKAKGSQALVEAKQWATAADAYVVENNVASGGAISSTGAISTTAGTNGTIKDVTVSGGHVYFTYEAVNGFNAVRNTSDGAFTVTKR